MIKEFSDSDIIQNLHFADMGEYGDFYAKKLVAGDIDICLNRMEARGTLLKGGEERVALIDITFPPEVDVISLSAGQLFQAAWDDWQMQIF